MSLFCFMFSEETRPLFVKEELDFDDPDFDLQLPDDDNDDIDEGKVCESISRHCGHCFILSRLYRLS